MKARIKRAQKNRTKVNRKGAVKIVCYAGAVSKLLLIEAARRSGHSLSSFLVLAGLGEAARIKGVSLDEIAPEELERLRVKGRRRQNEAEDIDTNT